MAMPSSCHGQVSGGGASLIAHIDKYTYTHAEAILVCWMRARDGIEVPSHPHAPRPKHTGGEFCEWKLE